MKTKNQVGQKVKIVQNSTNPNVPLGVNGIISYIDGDKIYIKNYSQYFFEKDLEIIPLTKKDMENDISSLKKEIKIIEDKIEFMEILNDKYLIDIKKAELIVNFINC